MQAPMQLSYRGSVYNVTPAIAPADSEIIGKYRGVPMTFRSPLGVTSAETVTTLCYRGNHYLRVR
ncbi:hypothetical protein OsccyDRAFT_2236 [Leptolyngbyaceae cyanobacterium JSC-12]|nr:hypothetical protein OsccyDRAFT_2236 [Leptolyngbyaceae cyanobacterium JSC-12]